MRRYRASLAHISYPEIYEVTPAQLAIQSEIEQGQVTGLLANCNRIRIDHISFGFSGGF